MLKFKDKNEFKNIEIDDYAENVVNFNFIVNNTRCTKNSYTLKKGSQFFFNYVTLTNNIKTSFIVFVNSRYFMANFC